MRHRSAAGGSHLPAKPCITGGCQHPSDLDKNQATKGNKSMDNESVDTEGANHEEDGDCKDNNNEEAKNDDEQGLRHGTGTGFSLAYPCNTVPLLTGIRVLYTIFSGCKLVLNIH